MFVQSAGVGVQVATQIRGAVCCVIALSGGDDVEPEVDPDAPDWLAAVEEVPLGAAAEPVDEDGGDVFGASALLDFLAAGAFAAGFVERRDVPFATGCFVLDFAVTLDGRVVLRLVEGLAALAEAFAEPLDFESAAAAPSEAGALGDTTSRLNGERTVRLVDREASCPALPLFAAIGVAASAGWEPTERPPRIAASETGSKIELNDDRINCSSTKARTPHRNGLDPDWTDALVLEFHAALQSDSCTERSLRLRERRPDEPTHADPPHGRKEVASPQIHSSSIAGQPNATMCG
jgi:hypothetical protein